MRLVTRDVIHLFLYPTFQSPIDDSNLGEAMCNKARLGVKSST